jgi:hypothetical protein
MASRHAGACHFHASKAFGDDFYSPVIRRATMTGTDDARFALNAV